MLKPKGRILIVDDSLEDRVLYRRLITRKFEEEFDLHETDLGYEGLELIGPVGPDCILLDYWLPDMDGLEFLRLLPERAGRSAMPVVMLTGHGDESVAVEAMKLGCQDYLPKDHVTDDSLNSAIAGTIEKMALHEKVRKQVLELEEYVKKLEAALDKVKLLEGILPICTFCKKIRTGQDSWQRIEEYISKHSEARFSHSVCSECRKKHYPEYQ